MNLLRTTLRYGQEVDQGDEVRTEKKQQGNILLKKRKHPILHSDEGRVQFILCLQRILQDIENPYNNGLECFFILENSVDTTPEKIILIYKQRDFVEKFIRALKDGKGSASNNTLEQTLCYRHLFHQLPRKQADKFNATHTQNLSEEE